MATHGVSWGGKQLTAIPIGDGSSYYCPLFCDEVGLNKDKLFSVFSNPQLYQPPNADYMRYRGNELARMKFFVSHASVSAGVTPVYRYPGFQWAAVQHYMTLQAAPTQLGDIVRGLCNNLSVDGRGYDFTQTIGTLYRDGQDSIGWHSDKVKDIADDSLIFDISLGAQRTFSLRAKTGDAPAAQEDCVMQPGSAILLTTATNAAYQHAVLPQQGAGPRVSLVFRNIKTQLFEYQVERRIREAQRAKRQRQEGVGAARRTKKQQHLGAAK